ncbi:MAG TPA: alpha/beta hydrolase [Trueperaceae bacterium]
MSPLDQEIRSYLEAQSALRLPPIWEQPVEEARRAVRERTATMRRVPVGGWRDVRARGPGGELRLRVYQPLGARSGRGVVTMFHGGGFILGDTETYDPVCRRLCQAAGATVVSVGYRLAPEHPFPAAAEDAVFAAAWSLEHAADLGADPRKVVVLGDSAGGNLAAVAANALQRAPVPLAGQVLIYPVTDLRDVPGYASRTYAAEGYGLTQRAMEWFVDCYVPERKLREDPRASPLLATDLSGAPPALVLTVEYDPLTSEGQAYAQRLVAAGVRVEAHCVPGGIHGSFTNGEGWSVGEELWDLTRAWLAERFETGSARDALQGSGHGLE